MESDEKRSAEREHSQSPRVSGAPAAAFTHTSTVMATGDGELPVRLHPTAGSRVLTAAATHHLPARSTTAATRQLPARSTAAVAGFPRSYVCPVS